MNTPRISIIVPIYNVEDYLPRCLDSIIAQTFKDWELILVDDGSPDNCGSICDRYEDKDSRIIVIHKQHEGVSAARNTGMRVAKGEWITFIDSDDFISPTFVEELFAPVEKDPSLTFVHGGCMNYFDEGHTTPNQKYDEYKGDGKTYVFDNYWGFVFSKLFRKDILQQQSIQFDTRITIAEDHIFTLSYLFHIKSYIFVDCTGYYYYIRKGSATRPLTPCAYKDDIWLVPKIEIDLIEEFISKFNPDESASKKRRRALGYLLPSLLQLYRYILDATKRSDIFGKFREDKYKLILAYSPIRWPRKCLLRMLFNPYTFHLIDRFLVIAYYIRSHYRTLKKAITNKIRTK